ncbi:MAG: cation:proton antiporter [Bacteroidota bacterium]
MGEHILLGLTGVVVFGVSAQWLAWKTRLPAILVLLACGIIAGPVTGLLNPDELMGDLLSPFVSISVAIILFEGGLSLRMSEFRQIGGVVIKLITIGVLVTWVLAALAAFLFLELGFELSVLFGAILIVTGPTVIIPLLRQVRPTETAGSVLKWEGIVNDPIGAMMAVLVFEIILSGGFENISGKAGLVIVTTIVNGSFFGLLAAGILYFTLKKHWIPDFLQNPVTLMLVVAAFTASNMLQHESGLLAVTVMGIALANQRSVRVHHIIEFKENLQVLLISALFILLASRLKVEHLSYFNWSSAAFMAALFFIVRPAMVFASTIGSKLTLQEKAFLSWMAPRGIVAAAIAAIFALRLEQEGFADADRLVPYTFVVIIATVTVYGLTASPVTRLLGVAKPRPTGLMFVGAHDWALRMASILKDLGKQIILVDSNKENIRKANEQELTAYQANILSDYATEELDLEGVGTLLALTPNDEVNSLACLRFSEEFGSSRIFQLPLSSSIKQESDSSSVLKGRTLFHQDLEYKTISRLIGSGYHIEALKVPEGFNLRKLDSTDGPRAYALLLASSTKDAELYSVDNIPTPQVGDTLIMLAPKDFQI